MLWSRTNMKMHEECPAKWKGWYGTPYRERPPALPKSAKMLLGIAGHEILDPFMVWLMSCDPFPSDEEVTTWLQGQVDDWKTINGVQKSIKQEAVWILEEGKGELGPVIGALLEADKYGLEEPWYFDASWNWLGKLTQEQCWRKGVWGGTADVWWVKDNVLHVRDWKTGKVFPDWDQIKGYGLYGILVMPEITHVEGGFVFIKAGQTMTKTWTRLELLKHQFELVDKANDIETATEYPTNPAYYQCSSCPQLDCPDKHE